MRTFTIPALLIFATLLAPRARGQVRGESILGDPTPATNAAPVTLASQPKPNAGAAAQTTLPIGELVGFDRLAGYDLKLTPELEKATNHTVEADAKVNAMIPPAIRALDGRTLSVEGYMVPLDFEKDKVIEFMLVRDPMGCCYGGIPEMHQLIKLRVKSPGVEPVLFNIARARGVFHVGALREDGYLSSIYRMEAQSVKEAGK